MPPVHVRKIPAPCHRCGHLIARGQRFTWGKDRNYFHVPEECGKAATPETPETPETPAAAGSPAPAPAEETPPAFTPVPTESHESNGGILSAIEQAITPAVYRIARQAFNLEEARAALLREAHELVTHEVSEAVSKARIPITLEIRRPDATVFELKNTHRLMPRLLDYAGRRKNTYLWGPPGGGKSTAAAQVAEALGLQYGYISLNPQTPDWKLLGFITADGRYIETDFYRCYTQGGVYCIDELDNSSASLLTTLNGMIENGHGAFPLGLQRRHADFCLITTGNTNGRGGDVLFPERRCFDAAFANRFRFVKWEYDETLEETLTLAVNPHASPWLRWVRTARAFCLAQKIKVFVSPRAAIQGAEDLLNASYSPLEVADSLAFQGISGEIKSKILAACPLPVGMVQV